MNFARAAAVGVVSMVAGQASAALIEYSFFGQVTAVNEPELINAVFAGAQPGDDFTLVYVFESTSADQLPGDSNLGRYGDISYVQVSVESASLSGNVGDISSGSFHKVNATSGDESYSAEITFANLVARILLGNTTATPAFASDANPGLNLPFAGLPAPRTFSLNGSSSRVTSNLDGEILRFSSREVPTPGTAALVVVALGVMSHRRRN